jgi:hypothetical protein
VDGCGLGAAERRTSVLSLCIYNYFILQFQSMSHKACLTVVAIGGGGTDETTGLHP